ncbi:hydroxylysine kinase-like [Styela clava]|uniref:hydroxylysine kinase-like n=1 Tax=Styela clava TaxID=7725 RepID=UPI001939A495|nr:hydroxylysine kinase-like [Styela clava]
MVSRIPKREVWNLLQKYYNIIPSSVSKMAGYSNINYKVTANDCISPITDCKTASENFLLKFADVSHVFYLDNIDMQHEMLKHLHLHGINASLPVESTHGETMIDYSFGGKQYSVQLLSFVNGVSMNEADTSQEEVIDIAYDMGQLCGRFHHTMKTFNYDLETASGIHSPFHTENAAMFEEKLAYVGDRSLRNQLINYMNLFKENFLPRLSELRKGFIHGDMSDTNIILKDNSQKGGQRRKRWEIGGLIDLEECAYTYLVGEVGICAAYSMLKAASVGADPVEASLHMIQGYQLMHDLSAREKEVLFYAVLSRLAVSYVSACYECFLTPENSTYLFTQAKNVPVVLEALEECGKNEIEKIWFGRRYKWLRQHNSWRNKAPPKE